MLLSQLAHLNFAAFIIVVAIRANVMTGHYFPEEGSDQIMTCQLWVSGGCN